jgi:uncharacterized protein (TIGR03435 family)
MRLAAGLLLVILGAYARAQQPEAQFEVAVIKPANAEDGASGSSGIKTGKGRASAKNVTLKRCIIGSYHIGPGQVIGGPSWIDSAGFDIEAKAAEPVDDDALLDKMMQALLRERFHLRLHSETREMKALVLEVAKSGPKLEKAAGGDASTNASHGRMTLKNTTMDGLAERLARVTSLPVANHTGIDGIFDMQLVWTPDGESSTGPGSPPALVTAIREQLGLRLETKKTPVQVLVIDHAEKPDEN